MLFSVWKSLVKSNMFSGLAEEKVWTAVMNNMPAQTSVLGGRQKESTALQITYNVTDEQVNSDHT